MHEMALCQGLMGMIEEQASVHDYSRVKAVVLEVGRLACVEPEALRFSFDVAARGTLAEGAALEIVEIRPEAWCPACGQAVQVEARIDPCPDCGGFELRLSGGDELRLKELEVD